MMLNRYPFLFVSLIFFLPFLHGTTIYGQDTETELLEVEARVKNQIQETIASIEELKASNDRLKEEQNEIEIAIKAGREAKMKRAVKLSNDQSLLDGMRRELGEKQQSVMKLNAHITDLRTEIADMDAKLSELLKSHTETQMKYLEPRISDVLEYKSQTWNTVPRMVYSKTVNKIFPAVDELSKQAKLVKEKVSMKSKILTIAVTTVIYGFVVAVVLGVSRIYTKIKGNITIAKVLFIGDAICACFWYLVLLCYLCLWREPLTVIRTKNELLFLMFQIVALISYIFYVLLRVLMLAATLLPGALGEVISVIVVGHHYYVRVWEPAMTGHQFHGTIFYYLCYAWLFSAFAFSRIEELSPLRQIRGTKLPIVTWLRVLKNHFTRSDVPDDVDDSSNSSDYSDTESDSDA